MSASTSNTSRWIPSAPRLQRPEFEENCFPTRTRWKPSWPCHPTGARYVWRHFCVLSRTCRSFDVYVLAGLWNPFSSVLIFPRFLSKLFACESVRSLSKVSLQFLPSTLCITHCCSMSSLIVSAAAKFCFGSTVLTRAIIYHENDVFPATSRLGQLVRFFFHQVLSSDYVLLFSKCLSTLWYIHNKHQYAVPLSSSLVSDHNKVIKSLLQDFPTNDYGALTSVELLDNSDTPL